MIHKTAFIDSKAKISSNVKIGAYTVIGPNVIIDENSEIQSKNDRGAGECSPRDPRRLAANFPRTGYVLILCYSFTVPCGARAPVSLLFMQADPRQR